MPAEDSPTIGHKFPFNACEILCSLNGFNINRIMDLTKEKKDKEKKEIEENRKKKMKKLNHRKNFCLKKKKEIRMLKRKKNLITSYSGMV